MLEAARLGGAAKAYPVEYWSGRETFKQGEALLQQGEVEGAEDYFLLALVKAKLLEKNLAEEKLRRAEEARRRRREEKLELARQRALLEEQRRVAQEQTAAAAEKIRAEKIKQQPKEQRPLQTHHTVKRGETLPQIAAQADVYNDYRLWPLLYRANRDQIRDPRHIWPGQLLRIPRNLSREDLIEARRYAQEKPL